MGRFTREELVQRAGVAAGEVDRLLELGIVGSSEDPAPFTEGDVRRVRFVHGLEQGGIPVEAVGSAVRSGDLSFAFFDWSYWDRLGGLSTTTYREVSSTTGVPLEMLQSIRESMGHARPGPDDHVREDELAVISLAKTLLDLGADPVTLERHIRLWGESVRRIAEADANFYRAQVEAPLLEAGLSWSEMLQAGSVAAEAIGPMLDPALLALYHAQSEHTWLTNVVRGGRGHPRADRTAHGHSPPTRDVLPRPRRATRGSPRNAGTRPQPTWRRPWARSSIAAPTTMAVAP